MTHPTRQDLIDFVVMESRLLDARRFDEWNTLFTDDAFYWVPLIPDQEDGLNHTSHMYEDKLLRTLRIERLKSPRAFSQQPPSRCHHLLQTPTVEAFDGAANRFRLRTEFHY
ncbi:MAG: nuclear transport factor 2 family protein, partial [Bacteriovorax sp.]|nr:nuclear transport factor 2 family protein [Rhizobacter sp.]